MTPYQFSRTPHRQRMLAGLNTLGFAIPPTQESIRAGALMPNLGVDLKVGGATVGSMSAIQQANTLAPSGTFKNLIGGTLQDGPVSSGIDARNSSAGKLLTAAGDQLDLRSGSLLNMPPKTGFLPGSTINPGRPDITVNPFNNRPPIDLNRLPSMPSTPRKTTGEDMINSMKPKSDPVLPGSSSNNDVRTTNTPPVTSTPDPRASFTDQRPPVPGDRLGPDDRPAVREDLEVIFPELVGDITTEKKFPVAMVVAGVGVVGLIAFLLLRK